ncbi:uncharacterized protein METZ01_LOCUS429566, partial [marine metagenome]
PDHQTGGLPRQLPQPRGRILICRWARRNPQVARQANHTANEQVRSPTERRHGKQQGRDVDDGAQHPKSRQSL